MSLHTTNRAREKILLAGPWGSGKSYARNRLINVLAKTGSDSRVYLFDTDDTYDLAWDQYGADVMASVGDVWACTSYLDWVAGVETIIPKVTRDDWVVIDRLDLLWNHAQDYFIQKVYGVDSAEFYLEFAVDLEENPRLNAQGKPVKEGSPLAGAHGQKWDHIKRQYAEVLGQLIFPPTTLASGKRYGHPGHVLSCVTVKELNSEQEKDSTIIRDFQRFGKKPAGEKNLPSQHHSVLMMSQGPPWYLNTARERAGREYLNGVEVTDFVFDYLIGVGGWEL